MRRLGTKVNYFGLSLWITMPYVAATRDGAVYELTGYGNPLPNGYWDSTDGAFRCDVDLEGKDWTTTLKQYNLETGEEII